MGVVDVLCCKQPEKPQNTDSIDFNNQSREMEGRVDNARINTMNKSDELHSFFYPDCQTLHQVFLKGKKLSNDGYLYGTKPSKTAPFEWLKYSEVEELFTKIGSGFIELGLNPKSEEYIGIFAKNRVEWCIVDQAVNAYSYVTVPIYDTLGDEAISFILSQTELKLVVCDNSTKAMALLTKKSNLKYLVVIEEITEEVENIASEKNIQVMSFEALKDLGAKNLKQKIPPNTNDLATICYTSGTTGMPKGAMITNLNMVSVVSSVVAYMKKANIKSDDEQERYISYLPLAHMMERCSQAVIQCLGGKIGFFQGDIKLITDDIKELKPTIFVTVPRLMNRIYGVVKSNVEKASPLKQKLFNWAFNNKEQMVLSGTVTNSSIYDRIFKPVRANLGGCVKMMLTGSAPISPEVFHFMRVIFGCYLVEGYGATETGGAAGMSMIGDPSIGTCGPPFLCTLYKLIDVPDMKLVAAVDNRGEICVYGSNIFKGYFKDPEKTKAVLIDGWYHTGDIGTFNKDGTLKIVDRVKNIFKLQQGEYIAPEKIENIYVKSKWVAQIFVYGDSLKSVLIAIVVPDEECLKEWAAENEITDHSMQSLCKNDSLRDLILKDIVEHGKNDGLKSFEQVKKIHLHYELFSLENGLVTPTFKSKRIDLKKYFQKVLDEMYSDLD